MQTGHEQEFYTTRDGKKTLVDVGLVEILELIAELGVETEYSCQGGATEVTKWEGGDEGAYICAKSNGFDALVRRMLVARALGRLSKTSQETVRRFVKGQKTLEASWFKRRTRGHYRSMHHSIRIPPINDRYQYSLERSFSNEYGSRLTVRWPSSDTPKIHQLLLEMKELK